MAKPVYHRYLLALGSNRPDHIHGRPDRIVRAAIGELEQRCAAVSAASPVIASTPLGPSSRRFANAAVTIDTTLPPPALLSAVKTIERDFGRRRGRRWGSRVLDIDIILWSGGRFRSAQLMIPHQNFRERSFVLQPAKTIAPDWRDPVTGLTLHQLAHRIAAPKPLDRGRHPL